MATRGRALTPRASPLAATCSSPDRGRTGGAALTEQASCCGLGRHLRSGGRNGHEPENQSIRDADHERRVVRTQELAPVATSATDLVNDAQGRAK